MEDKEAEDRCHCSETPAGKSYWQCYLCLQNLCLRCARDKNIEDQMDQIHAVCPRKSPQKSPQSKSKNVDLTKSPQSNFDKNSDTNIESATTPKDKISKQSESNSKESNLSINEDKNEDEIFEKKVSRSMPEELQDSTKNENSKRVGEPFPINPKQDYHKQASYVAINRAFKNASKTCGSMFSRVETTKHSDPKSNLNISFQFRSKVTWDNNKTEFYSFDYGNTEDLSADEDYKQIPIDEHVKLQLKNLKKMAKNNNKQKGEKSKNTPAATEVEVEDNSDIDIEKTPDRIEKSKNLPTPKTKQTPPMVSVTPKDCIRAPFDRTSGQSNAVKMPPKTTKPPKVGPKIKKNLPKNTKNKFIDDVDNIVLAEVASKKRVSAKVPTKTVDIDVLELPKKADKKMASDSKQNKETRNKRFYGNVKSIPEKKNANVTKTTKGNKRPIETDETSTATMAKKSRQLGKAKDDNTLAASPSSPPGATMMSRQLEKDEDASTPAAKKKQKRKRLNV